MSRSGPSPWAVVAVLALGALLRLHHPGADVPLDVEPSEAPLQDALWYLEGATAPVELGRAVEPFAVYDPPVWTHAARTWLRLAGSSFTSVHLLAGLVSLATLALVWRLGRAALGPWTALAAAGVLAVLPPAVALGRTPLIYGPVGLWLCAAAACWLAARRIEDRRLAARGLELLAWLAVALAAAYVRPPAAALAGGLALGHLVRARRPGHLLLLLAGAAAGLALLLWLDPADLLLHNRERLARYLARDVSPAGLLLRALRVLGPRTADLSGSGFLELAPGAWAAAAIGAVALLRRWGSLPAASRELAAVALGWLLTFVLAAALLDYRPARYLLVVVPPLGLLAGAGLVAVAGRAAPAPGQGDRDAQSTPGAPAPGWVVALAGLVGGLAGAHGLDQLLRGPRPLGPLLVGFAAGASLAAAACVGRFEGGWTPRIRRAAAALLALAVCGGGLARGLLEVIDPTTRARDVQRGVGAMLGPGAVVVGPFASFAALGHGLDRRRAPWIDADDPRTAERLRTEGATHLAVGVESEVARDVVDRLLENVRLGDGPARLVGVIRPRGVPILLIRFGWAIDRGYVPTDFEQRRGEDDGSRQPRGESEAILLEARVRALTWEGNPTRASDVAKISTAVGVRAWVPRVIAGQGHW